MRLSDADILRLLDAEQIRIDPRPDTSRISGVSVDVLLGSQFRVFQDHTEAFIDLSGPKEKVSQVIDRVMSEEIEVAQDDLFFLHPGQFALGVTHESVTLPDNIVGWLDGRSSLARLGLMVHATAHRIDPGWSGHVVLEFYNCGRLPLALKPGMKIGAFNFETLSSPALKPYNKRMNAKYKSQQGAVVSKISEDGHLA